MVISMIRDLYSNSKASLLVGSVLVSALVSTGCQPPNQDSQSALDQINTEQDATDDVAPAPVIINEDTIAVSSKDILSIKSSRYQPSLGLQGKIEPVKQSRFVTAKPVLIEQVLVQKGQWVEKGTPLVVLRQQAKTNAPVTSPTITPTTIDNNNSNQTTTTKTAEAVNKASPKANPTTVEPMNSANSPAANNSIADSAVSSSPEQKSTVKPDSSLITVRASFSGRVNQLAIKNEQSLTAGSLLLTLGDDTDLRFIATLPVQAEPQLSIGQTVNFTNQQDQKKYTGQVSKLVDSKDAKNLLVYVHVLNNEVSRQGELKPGMIVTGRVDYGQIEVGTIVPKRAIHDVDLSVLQKPPYQPLAPLSANVWIVKQDQRLTRQPIEVIEYFPTTGQYLIAGINNDSLICLADLPIESAGRKVVIK